MVKDIEFFDGTEAQILALTSSHPKWIERAFYYPSDKDYFYQVLGGRMRPFGKIGSEGTNAGVGVKINGQVMGGVKTAIADTDTVTIPTDYDYNTFALSVAGAINCDGGIHII